MQADVIEGYAVGTVVLVCAIIAAFRLEQVDLTQTNPTPAGANPPVPLSHRISRKKRIEAAMAAEQKTGAPGGSG
jgi:hypothetical protein